MRSRCFLHILYNVGVHSEYNCHCYNQIPLTSTRCQASSRDLDCDKRILNCTCVFNEALVKENIACSLLWNEYSIICDLIVSLIKLWQCNTNNMISPSMSRNTSLDAQFVRHTRYSSILQSQPSLPLPSRDPAPSKTFLWTSSLTFPPSMVLTLWLSWSTMALVRG